MATKTGVAITRGRTMGQGSFLPSLDAIALPLLGRVKFPGTKQAGRGVLSDADRLPRQPIVITGPSSYTGPVRTQRVGQHGYPVHSGHLL